MGRTAKHLSIEAKAKAARGYDLKYSQKQSSKIIRATARRARHLAKTTRHESSRPLRCIPGLPPLPALVQSMYNEPLPENHAFFRQALEKAGSLDESDLARWKKEPPFVEDEDERNPHSEDYTSFTTSLMAVLHGVRLREQNEEDTIRRTNFKVNGWMASIEILRREVGELLVDWARVVDLDIYHGHHQPREWLMHRHYIQWLARRIYRLYYLKFLD
ncbi:hypothetical protein C8R43DRAFT_1127279 [Mycena crocata]|nr:hypothetical protein C8R43DRAFT_1127279 [Mycena crocata]